MYGTLLMRIHTFLENGETVKSKLCLKCGKILSYDLMLRVTSNHIIIMLSPPHFCHFCTLCKKMIFLVLLWSVMMDSRWRHTRWSWLPPFRCLAETCTHIHSSKWEEFKAIFFGLWLSRKMSNATFYISRTVGSPQKRLGPFYCWTNFDSHQINNISSQTENHHTF